MRALAAPSLQLKVMREVPRLHLRALLYVLFRRGLEVLDLLGELASGRVSRQVCVHRCEGQHHLLQLHRQSRSIPLGNPLRSPKVLRTNYTGLISPLPFGNGALRRLREAATSAWSDFTATYG